MLWLCFKLPSFLLGNTKDMSFMHEQAKFACFIYMQLRKMKFKFVQINMKQVSYFVVIGLYTLYILHSNLKKHIFSHFLLFVLIYGEGLVKSWLVRQIFPVHQTGCPVKSRKLS